MRAQWSGKNLSFTAEAAMHHSRSRYTCFSVGLMAVLAAVVLAGCQAPTPPTSSLVHAAAQHSASRETAPISGNVEKQIAKLREVTARFQRFEAAAAAGWGARITPCFVDAQLGGMGYHYGNTALFDATVNALEPELLLYEPQKNGRLRFVAVEYIVPFAAWTAQDPPQLYGQSFHRNEAFGLWVLHVWHFRNNPHGMFADWNPNVSCDYAAER